MGFKKGLLYVFFSNLIFLIVSVFTGFVLPKFLSIETYADIKLFQLYITYLGILHLGFADGMYLRLGGKKYEDLDKKEIMSEYKTFKVFQIIISVILISVTLIMEQYILFLCALSILPVNIASYLRLLFQATGKFKKYSNFTNFNTLLVFAANIMLLFIIKTDYSFAYILAYVAIHFIYWFVLEREIRKEFPVKNIKLKKLYLVEDIKSGITLMLGNFCNVVFTSIDRLFVQNILGTVKFAFYSFAVSIENLMNVFIQPISIVMYNYCCNNNTYEKIMFVKRTLMIASALIIGLVFPAKFVVETWITNYIEAIDILIILFTAQYFSIIVKCLYNNLYKAEKKQNRYFVIMLSVIVLSIILNVIALSINKSMQSVAIATLITNFVWLFIVELDFKQYHSNIKGYFYMALVVFTFVFTGMYMDSIIGCLTYYGIVLVATIIFMNKDFKYYKGEVKNFLKARK